MRRTETKKQPGAFREPADGEKGFTLIETSVAMVIMMVAALGAAGLFTYSIRYNSGGNDRAVALSIAQQQLELLRSAPFNDTLLNTTSSAVSDIVNNGRTYRVTRTVTAPTGNVIAGNPTFKVITIQVRPTAGGFPVVLHTARTTSTATNTY